MDQAYGKWHTILYTEENYKDIGCQIVGMRNWLTPSDDDNRVKPAHRRLSNFSISFQAILDPIS